MLRSIRYALRSLARNPGFTAGLVVTLGLGIGASAAMFSVVDALLLRPLPYGEPSELVHVRAFTPAAGYARPVIAWEEARAWTEGADFLEGVLLHTRRSVLYTGGAEPRMLPAVAVSPGFEQVLQVQPVLGRGFVEADAAPGAGPAVVLSHGFWRAALGADSAVIGRRIELEGIGHRIVGVMPAGFKFPYISRADVWLPLHRDGTVLGEAGRGTVRVVGRLRTEWLSAAQARAEALSTALAEANPEIEWSARLVPMDEDRAQGRGLHPAIWFLSGAVALILLVAAVNAMGLLLVRGWSRARELAVRTALGASRRRLVGAFIAESTLLALLSGGVAVVLAMAVVGALRGIMPYSITFFAPYAIEVEQRTLVFAFGIAVTAGLLVGLIPAIQATRRSAVIARSGLTPYAARTPAKSRLRRALVVGSVALSVMLLVGAGLLINSFVRLTRVDPGYRVEELAIMSLTLSDHAYPSGEERAAFVRRLEQRLEALPGVEGTTMATGGFHFAVELEPEGRMAPPDAQPEIVPFAGVTPDYFRVLEIPLRAGRAFTRADAGTDNVMVDRELARFLWGGANPVGRRFRIEPESPWLMVVGVINDLKLMGPDDRTGDYEILYPRPADRAGSYVSMAMRTRGDPTQLFPSIRDAVHDLAPTQPIYELRPATEVYAETIDMPRFLFILTSVLSGLALVLAAIGIHGVLAYAVVQRRRDLGIRIALGAPAAMLSRTVVREGLVLAALGTLLGIAAALALAGLIRGLLYGIAPTDPATIALVATVSLAVAALASYMPARRATRVDPMVALRAE